MHDLESFFWVLFWICMHFGPAGKPVEKHRALARWCTDPAAEVARSKLGTMADPDTFATHMETHSTSFHKLLLPVMEAFRRAVFPSGRPWKYDSLQLYDKIMNLLRVGAEALDRA